VGVHGDDCPDFAFESFFGGHLDVQIDGEPEVFARDGEFLAEVAKFFSVAVDDNVATAVNSAEESVIRGFYAGTADHVPGRVECVSLVCGEHLLGNFAHIADEVSGKSIAGVEATLLVESLKFGELVPVGGDEGLLVRRDVLFQRNGLVLGGDLKATDGCLNLLNGDVEALGYKRQVGIEILNLFAEQVAGNRGIVVDQKAAFAVEKLAAGSEHGNLADAVGFGERTKTLGVEHLEPPESGEEYGENERDEILGGVKLAGGQLLGLADVLVVGGVGMVDWFHAYSSVYD
jgi:hypothetical protein